ncbi:MAG: thiamine pyrophosphate-binding protein [Chloroflexi bacterium]|nr:thiamine pyrophosphate-binding protein [Chloroflexota bacterium]
MEHTGAELIVEGLKLEGVDYLFGMSSSEVLPLLDVIGRTPEIHYVQSQHEQWAAYMANGYARAGGKTGTCLVGPGPGTANCASPMGQALYTFAPTFLMAIEDSTKIWGLGSMLHHGLDSVAVMKPVSKMSVRVERAGRLPDLMRMGFRLALSPKRGPVFLAIPTDVLAEQASVELVASEHSRVERIPAGDPQDLDRMAALLLAARRPVALAGPEVSRCQAQAELIGLSELLAMPVAGAAGNKGIIPEDHPLALGVIGLHGRPYAHQTVREADLILALGAPFTEFATDRFEHKIIPEHPRIIQIDIAFEDMGKIYPIELGLVGDIKETLKLLAQHVLERRRTTAPFQEAPQARELSKRKNEWEASVAPMRTSSRIPIHPLRLMTDLRKALPRDAFAVAVSGSTSGWFEYGFEALTHTLEMGEWHPMGAEYCEAMGAKLAWPETPVVPIMGDGSMMMCLSEIATAVKYNIPVLAMVTHNDVFGNMRHTQIARFGGRFIGTDLHIPNLANVAREFGAYGERVSDPEQIIPAVKRAMQSGKPALLEIMTDTAPEALAHPRS